MKTAFIRPVFRHLFTWLTIACGLFAAAQGTRAEGLLRSKRTFYYRSADGHISHARIVRHYFVPRIHPNAEVDPRIDPRMRRAVSIAQERAYTQTKARCWRFVKEALLAAGVINSYPSTAYACDAGAELVQKYGFTRLPIRDPYAAPLGAVIVYGRGAGGAGHVELRTKDGFVSDYRSKFKCYYPVLAVYGKFSS